MELHTFGSDTHAQLHPSLSTQIHISNPTIAIDQTSLSSIQILWSSWCDALIAWQIASDDESKLLYTGSGLREGQFRYVKTLENLRDRDTHLQFFGTPLGEGLQGVLNTKDSTITLFISDGVSTYTPPDGIRIQHIAITSGGTVSLVAAHVRYSGSSIASFPSLKALQAWLAKETSAILPKMLQTFPSTTFSQLLGNATTSIALTEAGEVFTWTQDPRYPKLLGRSVDADTPANLPHQIEYLSETKIVQIASGGYLTAALSSDGELFLWGQNCPGTRGCLKVLQQSDEDDIDKFVKCVEITINDKEAKVTHVAIGSGHVIVAAETARRGERMERAAFVMGQGESGQLGIGRTPELVEEFTEVPELKGKKVVQMKASGWNSWIVTEHNH